MTPASEGTNPTDGRGPVLRWLGNSYAGLSEGQRWTIALVVLLTGVFIGYGLRRESVPPTYAAAPLTRPSATGAAPSTTPPGGGTAGTVQPLSLGTSTEGSLPSYSSSEPASGEYVMTTGPGEETAPPGSSPTTCPVSAPSTGTPLDTITAEIESLCLTLEPAPNSSGSVPTADEKSASLPGPEVPSSPGISAGTSSTAEPERWATIDEVVGASNPSAPSDRPRLSVTLGILEGNTVPTRLASKLTALSKSGVEVHLLLVPDLARDRTPAAFGSWARRVAAALPAAETVAVLLGAVPPADVPDLSAYVLSADAAVRTVPVGIWWADGGLSPADQMVWTALSRDLTAAGRLPAFVGTTLPDVSQCDLLAPGHASVAEVLSLIAAPVVVEALDPSAPSLGRCPSTPSAVTRGEPALSPGAHAPSL